MSRDILFHPVAQGTYALLSIVAHCNRKAEEAAAMEAAAEEGDSSGCGQAFSSDLNVLVLEDDADGGEGGQAVEREEEEEEEEDAALQENAEPWVLTLEHGEYNDLSLAERVQVTVLASREPCKSSLSCARIYVPVPLIYGFVDVFGRFRGPSLLSTPLNLFFARNRPCPCLFRWP